MFFHLQIVFKLRWWKLNKSNICPLCFKVFLCIFYILCIFTLNNSMTWDWKTRYFTLIVSLLFHSNKCNPDLLGFQATYYTIILLTKFFCLSIIVIVIIILLNNIFSDSYIASIYTDQQHQLWLYSFGRLICLYFNQTSQK